MRFTLEEILERQLSLGYDDDDFIVKQLRRQIFAKNTGKSFRELYVSGRESSTQRKKLAKQDKY